MTPSPPEVVVTDPPRAGMHPQVIQALLEISPQRIIAVSCNPATLARDLALLQGHYDIVTVEPYDLFPHTAHIECVVRLRRRRLKADRFLYVTVPNPAAVPRYVHNCHRHR